MRLPCTIDGCERLRHGRRLCATHYRRLIAHGSPHITHSAPDGAPEKWLRDHVGHEGDECLIFPFRSETHDGYGMARINGGRSIGAHRAMCILAFGNPPKGYQAAHSCMEKKCCNPRHLRWATAKDNCLDKIKHGTIVRGENMWCSKLTDDDVRSIRRKWDLGATRAQLAREFGVSFRTMEKVVLGMSWRHVK